MNDFNALSSIIDDESRYLPAMQEMYDRAKLVVFDEMIRTGYTNRALQSTHMLAQLATSFHDTPDYNGEYRSLVDEYVQYARNIIGGRG